MVETILMMLLGALPQSILTLFAALGLVGAKSSIRRVLIPGVILASLVMATRAYPALLGWHIPIFFAAYLLLARLFRLAAFLAALTAAALSFILVALADVLLVIPFLELFDLSYDQVLQDAALNIAFSWLENILLVIGAIAVARRNFVLIPVVRDGKAGGGQKL